MIENIYSKLQHRSDIHNFTASWPCSKVTVSLWAENFPFVAYVMWMTTGLYFRSIHKWCNRTDSRYDRSSVHKAVSRTEHCCDCSLVVILQHSVVLCCVVLCCVVLWLKGIAINWLQMIKNNLPLKWSCRRTFLTVVTADQSSRFLWNVRMYLPTSQCLLAEDSSLHYNSLVSLLRLLQQ